MILCIPKCRQSSLVMRIIIENAAQSLNRRFPHQVSSTASRSFRWLLMCLRLAMESYIPAIQANVLSLQEKIKSRQGQPMQLNELMNHYSFDTMGHVVYPQAYDSLPVKSRVKTALNQVRALGGLGIVLSAPWLAILALNYMPRVWRLKDWHEMVDTSDELIRGSMDVRC